VRNVTWSKWGLHALRSPCGRYSITTAVTDGWSVYLLWKGREIILREEARESDRARRKVVVEGMMEGVR
jgi:hypothetical protein